LGDPRSGGRSCRQARLTIYAYHSNRENYATRNDRSDWRPARSACPRSLETILGKIEVLENTTSDTNAKGRLRTAKDELLRLLPR
jgi:hypothetical protein